jgi:hypothetical protein
MEAHMGHGKPHRESMFSQIIVGVVVSVVTTVLLRGFGLEDSSSPAPLTTSALSSSSVRISYQLPEPLPEPFGSPSALFDCRAVSTDPVLGFVPEPLRLSCLP